MRTLKCDRRAFLINDTEWNGLDTIIVSAGVSALQSILGTAGVERPDTAKELHDIDSRGINKAVLAAESATRVNYYGPLVVAVTFVSHSHHLNQVEY